MTDSRQSKLVSMRLQPETVDRVNLLMDATGKENRTQLTAEAIALAAWWVEAKEKGAEIYAEYPDGEREKIVLPGLEPIDQNNHESKLQPA